MRCRRLPYTYEPRGCGAGGSGEDTRDSTCACVTRHIWAMFSGIGVDGLVPEKTGEAREQMKSIWKTVARGPFGGNVNFGSDDEDEEGEE